MEYFNPVLLLIFVAEVCLGICAWHSPRFLRRVAAHLLTRSEVVEVSRQESERRMKLWLNELGLEDDSLSTQQPAYVSRIPQDEAKAS
jgi:hypothetical protein